MLFAQVTCATAALLALLGGAQAYTQASPHRVCLEAVGGSLDPYKNIRYKKSFHYDLRPGQRDLNVKYESDECVVHKGDVGVTVRGLVVKVCDSAVPTVDTSRQDPTSSAHVHRNGNAAGTAHVQVDVYCGPVYFPNEEKKGY